MKLVSLATLFSRIFLTEADLPVHCLRHQVQGEWEFTVSPLEPKRSSCGHSKPDDPNKQPSLDTIKQFGQTSTKRFTLQDPDTVSGANGETGTWTMIYDEGFEVATGDLTFFAFSKFSFVPGKDGQQTNVSHCDETQVGWYHNKARDNWGCYVGKMVGSHKQEEDIAPQAGLIAESSEVEIKPHSDSLLDDARAALDTAATPPPPVDTPQSPDASLAADLIRGQSLGDPDASSDTLSPDASSITSLSADSSSNPFFVATTAGPTPDIAADAEKAELSREWDDAGKAVAAAETTASPFAEDVHKVDDAGVSFITRETIEPVHPAWVPESAGYDQPMQDGWQQNVADALNFLQLGWKAESYDKFTGKTPRELNKLAGTRRDRFNQHSSRLPGSSFLGVGRKVQRTQFLEANFDWRRKDGKNWITPVVTQGDCGSCYTISTVHMLTARNRIAKGDHKEPSFSVSFPLYCSEYNQGCDGGYGFLQTKWSEDVGLIPERCAPFSEGGGMCQVDSRCKLGEQRYRATNHHYVGGYYGGSTAENIRQELVAHGPVVMSFEPQEDFMYYKSGVYRSGPSKIHQEWEQVDHAVMLVGYGNDKGKQGGKYWTLQNSWGDDWGEAGYFRMARGTDESGCESIVVAAEVVEEESNSVLESLLSSM